MKIIDVLLACKLAAAGGEARRKVAEGCVRVNGERVVVHDHVLSPGDYKVSVGLRRPPVNVTIQSQIIIHD